MKLNTPNAARNVICIAATVGKNFAKKFNIKIYSEFAIHFLDSGLDPSHGTQLPQSLL